MQFSPTGQSFAAATTEGVLLYRNNVGYFFDPWLPDVNINPQSIRDTFLNQDYSLGLFFFTANFLDPKCDRIIRTQRMKHKHGYLIITNRVNIFFYF